MLRAIQTVGDMLGDNTDIEPIIKSASVDVEQLATQKMQLLSQSRPVKISAYMHGKELKATLIKEIKIRIKAHISKKTKKQNNF